MKKKSTNQILKLIWYAFNHWHVTRRKSFFFKKKQVYWILLYVTGCVSLSEALFLIMEVDNRKFMEI